MMTQDKEAAWRAADKLAEDLGMAADAECVNGVANIGGMKECRIGYMTGSWDDCDRRFNEAARFKARTWAELTYTLEQADSMLASLISRFYEE